MTDYMLTEYGGHVELKVDWAYSLLNQMQFLQRKVMTAKSKHAFAEFCEMKEQFLDKTVAAIQMKEIPQEMILNWDQTGIETVPSSTWTIEQQETKCGDLVGAIDK